MIPPTDTPSDYSARPAYRVAAVPTRQRPLGVMVLAILKFLSAVLAVALIWFYQVEINDKLSLGLAGPHTRIGPYDLTAGLNGMMAEVSADSIRQLRIAQIVTVVDILLGLALGWGLWKMRRWVRSWGVGLAGLSIIMNLVSVVTVVELTAPLGIIVNGFVIWYLQRDNVPDAFWV